MVTATYWCIAGDTCIHLNPAMKVVFYRTELFANDYQVSNANPIGSLVIVAYNIPTSTAARKNPMQLGQYTLKTTE